MLQLPFHLWYHFKTNRDALRSAQILMGMARHGRESSSSEDSDFNDSPLGLLLVCILELKGRSHVPPSCCSKLQTLIPSLFFPL